MRLTEKVGVVGVDVVVGVFRGSVGVVGTFYFHPFASFHVVGIDVVMVWSLGFSPYSPFLSVLSPIPYWQIFGERGVLSTVVSEDLFPLFRGRMAWLIVLWCGVTLNVFICLEYSKTLNSVLYPTNNWMCSTRKRAHRTPKKWDLKL